MSRVLQFIEDSPIGIIRAQGCIITDSSGKTYLDFESGCWATSLGHAHPKTNQTIHDQIELVMHTGTRYPNSIVEKAAQAILNLLNMSDGKCILLSSGSEAVEFSVQCAKKIAPKPKLLCLSNTYLAAFGTSKVRSPEEWITFDWSKCETCQNKNCAECPDLAAIPLEQIGAFIFEPGSFSGQVKFPPVELIRELSNRVHKVNGWVVSNEITTGIGRTGKWFGFQHYGIQPDIVALGKGLGNGFPVSASAITKAAADRLMQTDMNHAQSHQNDPLGAAVALTVIQCIREENILLQCNQNGNQFIVQLNSLKEKYSIISAVRGKGLFIAIDIDTVPHAHYIHTQLVEHGFLTGYKPAQHTLRFFPPLNVKPEQINILLLNLEQILKTIPVPETA